MREERTENAAGTTAGSAEAGGEMSRDARRHEKFVRLAEARVGRLLNALHSLSRLSNRNLYRYHAEEVAEMFTALQEALDAARGQFATGDQGRARGGRGPGLKS